MRTASPPAVAPFKNERRDSASFGRCISVRGSGEGLRNSYSDYKLTKVEMCSLKTPKSRLDRRLAEKGEYLRKCSSRSPWWNELGTYYIAEMITTRALQTDIDPEALAPTGGNRGQTTIKYGLVGLSSKRVL